MNELLKKPLATLVRREFWEHRSLWLVPLIGAGLLLIGSLFTSVNLPNPAVVQMQVGPRAVYGTALAFAGFIAMIVCILVFFYLLDCLYAERKDRSILFWKSLPVSDTNTVLVKFAVGLVIVPVAAWLLILVTHLLATGVLALRGMSFGDEGGALVAWLHAQWRLFGGLVTAILWYAPVAAFLMLASVIARRAPMVWASIPVAVPMLVEKIFFGSNYIAAFVAHRLVPWRAQGRWMLDRNQGLLEPLSDPQLWLGLVAAAGILYMVIRLRRYRDDT